MAYNKLPWYSPTIGSMLTPEFSDLLTRYANIPSNEIEDRIYKARDTAFNTLPLGTIGEFWFLVLGLAQHPFYPSLLQGLTSAVDKSRPLFLDLGTCLGQDLRKLVLDGAEPAQVLGADRFAQFNGIGCGFFGDEASMAQRFVAADVFAEGAQDSLRDGYGTWTYVASSMLLHSFDWAEQVHLVKKMLRLTKGSESWLVGLLAGDVDAHEVEVLPPLVPPGTVRSRYIHDRGSLERLFTDASREAGVDVRIHVSLQEDPDSPYTHMLQQSYFATKQARLLFYWVEIV